MKKLLIPTVVAVALVWALWPSQASAYWAYRTVYRFDPQCCHTIPVTERYWVPDCDIVVRPYPYVPSCGYDHYYGHEHHDGYGYGGYPHHDGYGLYLTRPGLR
jgi:hypothetical protein